MSPQELAQWQHRADQQRLDRQVGIVVTLADLQVIQRLKGTNLHFELLAYLAHQFGNAASHEANGAIYRARIATRKP